VPPRGDPRELLHRARRGDVRLATRRDDGETAEESLELAGVITRYRQTRATFRPVGGERGHDQSPARAKRLTHDIQVSQLLFGARKEVEHRGGVPERVLTLWLPTRDVCTNPADWSRVADTLAGNFQR